LAEAYTHSQITIHGCTAGRDQQLLNGYEKIRNEVDLRNLFAGRDQRLLNSSDVRTNGDTAENLSSSRADTPTGVSTVSRSNETFYTVGEDPAFERAARVHLSAMREELEGQRVREEQQAREDRRARDAQRDCGETEGY
jgi:hypothetical protein